MINETILSPVQPSTLQHHLEALYELSKYITAKKPFINENQCKKRLNWAREHRVLTMVDWKRVIWTNEASVEVGKESQQSLVWCRPGKQYK